MARKKKTEAPVVVDVSLAESDRNYDQIVTFLEQEFRIVRVGADGDVDRVRRWFPNGGPAPMSSRSVAPATPAPWHPRR